METSLADPEDGQRSPGFLRDIRAGHCAGGRYTWAGDRAAPSETIPRDGRGEAHPAPITLSEDPLMCGIAGYIDLANRPKLEILSRMLAAISHRGPDADGIWREGDVGLVHSRLSIIDLQHSEQPMELDSSVLTFNGEIYNYRSLRDEAAVNCSTNGDTEVLLRGIKDHGVDFLSRIDGMFSFGYWDREKRRLILARDRFGKKPLFIARPRPDLLVFGSEPKALLEHPEVSDELDEFALGNVVRYGAVAGGRSLYSDIRQVPPGHAVEWEDGTLETREWFDPTSLISRKRQRFDIDLLETEFLKSVKARLVSDVPVGAFLSGGIDSSLLVSAMRRLQPEQTIHTFSISFEGDPDDEHEFASVVADRFETVHHRVVVGQQDFLDGMERYSRFRDAPLSQPADLGIGKMSEYARQHVKVVLSGEGADEAFAGYPKYQLAGLPELVVRGIGLFPMSAYMKIARVLGLSERRLGVAIKALREPNELARISQWFSAGTPDQLKLIFPGLWSREGQSFTPQSEAFARIQSRTRDPIQRMQFVDLLTWLPANLLERGDRMTMAEGLETRMPFMSEEMFRLGIDMRSTDKCSLRVTKKPLRILAERMVGVDIARRRKWGFRVPLEKWFKSHLGSRLESLLVNERSFVARYGERGPVDGLLAEHRSGHVDHQMILWTIFAIESWYQASSGIPGKPTD